MTLDRLLQRTAVISCAALALAGCGAVEEEEPRPKWIESAAESRPVDGADVYGGRNSTGPAAGSRIRGRTETV